MALITRLVRDETAASAGEYALILAIVGSGLAVGAIFLGNTISNSMNQQASTIETCGDGTCTS